MLGSTFDPHTTLVDRNGGVKEYFQVAEALGGSTSEARQLVMLVENRRVDAVNAAVLHALARAREDGLNEGLATTTSTIVVHIGLGSFTTTAPV